MNWKLRFLQTCLVVCLLFGLAGRGFSQKSQPTEKETTGDHDKYSEMTLEEIPKDSTTKVRAYMKRYRAAPTKEEKREVFKTLPTVKPYIDRLVEMINEDPGLSTKGVIRFKDVRGEKLDAAITELLAEAGDER